MYALKDSFIRCYVQRRLCKVRYHSHSCIRSVSDWGFSLDFLFLFCEIGGFYKFH